MGAAVQIRRETPNPVPDADLVDLRFRALLPEADWNALPAAVRAHGVR